MPPREAPAKKPRSPKAGTKKAASAKPPARKAAAKAPSARATKGSAKKAVPAKKAAAPRRAPGSPPVQRTRVVVPLDIYEPKKDAIKAPFKAHALKWNFLGEGKGLYKREDGGVHCFTQFKDDGVHYSVWGDDKKAVDAILAAWRSSLGEAGWAAATASGEQAAVAEQEQKESEALRLWRLGEPQRRPGEPDLFFQKRLAEWEAKKPT